MCFNFIASYPIWIILLSAVHRETRALSLTSDPFKYGIVKLQNSSLTIASDRGIVQPLSKGVCEFAEARIPSVIHLNFVNKDQDDVRFDYSQINFFAMHWPDKKLIGKALAYDLLIPGKSDEYVVKVPFNISLILNTEFSGMKSTDVNIKSMRSAALNQIDPKWRLFRHTTRDRCDVAYGLNSKRLPIGNDLYSVIRWEASFMLPMSRIFHTNPKLSGSIVLACRNKNGRDFKIKEDFYAD